jgi:hypothetical protein
VLRSTGAETVATLFYRVEETHALPANVPRTIMEIHDRASSNAQVVDHALISGLLALALTFVLDSVLTRVRVFTCAQHTDADNTPCTRLT